jgi:hypothetical protein
MTTTLEIARQLASRLPPYARMIALRSAHARLELMLSDPGALNVQCLQQIYQAAVGEAFIKTFDMTQADAYSAEEFLDFYLRHGIVCAKLVEALFNHVIQAAAQPAHGMLEESINRAVNETLEIVSTDCSAERRRDDFATQ